MQIRPITSDDLTDVARLRLALLEETGATLGADERNALLVTNEAFFRKNLYSPAWQSWCAEVDGHVVGVGTLAVFERPPYSGNPQGKDAYLLNMFTEPAYRGKGAAKAILHAALAHAKENGVGKVVLHASPDGRPMYDKQGFRASPAYMELSFPSDEGPLR
jgi:GNAT superfamily N-acetyltransferase